MCGRDPSYRPKLVLLCPAHRPRLVRPCRGTLPPQRRRLISNRRLRIANPRLPCVRGFYCFAICFARLSYQTRIVLLYSLQALLSPVNFLPQYPRASAFQQTLRRTNAFLRENAIRIVIALMKFGYYWAATALANPCDVHCSRKMIRALVKS